MDRGHRSEDGALAIRGVWGVAAIFFAVMLLWVALLVLERTGTTNGPVLQNSAPAANVSNVSGQAAAAGTPSGPVGAGRIFDQTANLAAGISGGGGTPSQITTTDAGPGQFICQQFVAGTATTLLSVIYDTKGTTIQKVISPGQFWYWVTVQAASAGTQTFTITETTNYAPTSGSPYFTLGSGSSAYDASCNSLSTSVSGGTAANPNVTVSFNAPSAGTFEIGIKETTHSIIGSGPASTTSGFSYQYTFATTGVSASTQGLNLTHQ